MEPSISSVPRRSGHQALVRSGSAGEEPSDGGGPDHHPHIRCRVGDPLENYAPEEALHLPIPTRSVRLLNS